jgi:ferric-dicitrate binding protein FerR (iron transport regulator)
MKGASFRGCRARGASREASASGLSRRTIRRLRANARGRFRTRGRNSSATVRGTRWEVIDRCDGTLTKVTRGRVVVRDFRRKRNVLVRAGKRYLAKARG